MANDDIWILGINMTKFGKHKDLDTVDLAAQAARAALADGGVTMKDIGVVAAGNLMGGGGIGQQLQKQIGQTGVPVYNVSNACATGATALRTAIMAIKAGETEMGLAVGVEKLAGAGLLGGGGKAKADKKTWEPSGRYGAVASIDGRIGTNAMPGIFAQVGMEYGHRYGGTSFELFARIAEKNHAHSTLNPLAAYTKRMTLGAVYTATLLFWLADESDGRVDTWAFLDRRIDEVIRFEGAKTRVSEKLHSGPSLARFLGRLRYPVPQ